MPNTVYTLKSGSQKQSLRWRFFSNCFPDGVISGETCKGVKQEGTQERAKQRYIFITNLASAWAYRELWSINCTTEFFPPWTKEPECLYLHISTTMTQDHFGKWKHIFLSCGGWSKCLEKWTWVIAVNPTAAGQWLDWPTKGNLNVVSSVPLITISSLLNLIFYI